MFTLGHNPSMGSVDSDMGYDMGSVHSDISLLEDPPTLGEGVSANSPGVGPAPFLGARPANPAMAALTSQHREAHNRSPISFREGRRASDTSLTQGQSVSVSVHLLFVRRLSLVLLLFFNAQILHLSYVVTRYAAIDVSVIEYSIENVNDHIHRSNLIKF